jgi:hypothetical protein
VKGVGATRERVARAVALAGAVVALAFALRHSSPLFLALAALGGGALASPFVEWTSPPPWLVRTLPRVHGLVLLVVGLAAWWSRSLGVLVLDPAVFPSLAGPLVVAIAAAFALAPRAFPPGRTLVPATIAVLALAGLDPSPSGYGVSALPFLRGADHSAFAEVYLALALVVLGASWAAALSESGPRWHHRDLLQVAFATALAAALAATGVVGLPLLQPRIERAVASALDQGTTGLSEESTLGEFAELSVSHRRVLDVEASVDGGRWLLRSEVFTTFDGRRWTNPPPPPAGGDGQLRTLLRPGPAPAVAGPLLADTGAWFEAGGVGVPGPTVDLRFVQQDLAAWPLVLPRGVTAVTVDAPFLEVDRFGNPRRPRGVPVSLYGAVLPAARVPDAASALSDAEQRESLTLPTVVDERVRDLARELAPPTARPRERLEATVAHLQRGYAYTLRPGAFRTRDGLAEFLFDKKAGYCEYFASAAVLLLRLQGVPARFVKGLSVGPQTDQGGGLHVVRESDAHAWVEAWLPGEGWVEADPTPPAQFASAHPPAGGLERRLQRARAAVAAAWARLTVRGPLSFLRVLARDLAGRAARALREPMLWVAAVFLALAPRLLSAWRTRRHHGAGGDDGTAAVSSDLRELVRALEGGWRAAGRPRPPGRGLLEHATSIGIGARAVALYYGARYGGDTPSPGEVDRLREALRDRESAPGER